MNYKNGLFFERIVDSLSQHGYKNDLSQLLGGGNHGWAWRLDNDTVFKLTNDFSEYNICKEIIGRQNNYLVDIYNCWELQDEDGDECYGIIEEKLLTIIPGIDQNTKDCFIKLLKESWSILNESGRVDRHENYYDFLIDNYVQSNKEIINIAYNVFCELIMNKENRTQYILMFDNTTKAFAELHKIYPLAELDLNSGNIGFSSYGQMKYFDMRCVRNYRFS